MDDKALGPAEVARAIRDGLDESTHKPMRDVMTHLLADRNRLAAEVERLTRERNRLIECWPYAASCVIRPRCVGSRGLPYAVQRFDGAITSWHATREAAVRAAAGLDAEGTTPGPEQCLSQDDARLIAADLLAACARMLATWGTDDEDEIIAARDAALAAIAKATGEGKS